MCIRDRVGAVRADHRRPAADRHVGERGVGTDDGILGDTGGTVQLGARLDAYVALDAYVDVDPRRAWIDDGDARELVATDGRGIERGTERGELCTVVAARDDQRIVDDMRADGLARGARDLDDVRQICLLYTSPSPRDATLSRMPSSA